MTGQRAAVSAGVVLLGAVGAVFIWSGFSGARVTHTIRDLLAQRPIPPATAPAGPAGSSSNALHDAFNRINGGGS